MSLVDQPLATRVRKAALYLRLYGPAMTIAKIQSHYHVKRRFDPLPPRADPLPAEGHVGIIGCGLFAFQVVGHFLRKDFGHVVRGVMDVDAHRAASLCRHYRAAYYTTDAEEIFSDPRIDLVYIVSNHASHAGYAIRALRAGKNVHLEKPPAVDRNELRELCGALREAKGSLRLGYNRDVSPFGMQVRELLRQSPGPAVMSWFVYGHDIPASHWYMTEGEGGRVLGNLCHWIDFVYKAVAPEQRYPITITPVRSEAPDTDLCVNYRFGDGSIASIAFASRGETFDGIHERFAAQKTGIYLTLDDFSELRVWDRHRARRWRTARRDHGHRASIQNSYAMSRPTGREAAAPVTEAYLWETGDLVLATKEALDLERVTTVRSFAES